MDLQPLLLRHLLHLKGRIAEKMASRTATGKTVASLRVDVTGDRGTLYGSPAFLTMERGRRPGAVPQNFTDILREWILAKGLGSGKTQQEITNFAGAVAHSIFKHGTRMYRRGESADIYSSAIEQELAELADEVALTFSQAIHEPLQQPDNDT